MSNDAKGYYKILHLSFDKEGNYKSAIKQDLNVFMSHRLLADESGQLYSISSDYNVDQVSQIFIEKSQGFIKIAHFESDHCQAEICGDKLCVLSTEQKTIFVTELQ